ncbi:MAG: CARDB domain-containing protein [Planctomycetota bacterium]
MTLKLVGYGMLGTGETGGNQTFPPNGQIAWGTTPIDIVLPMVLSWNFTHTEPRESSICSGDSGGPGFLADGTIASVGGHSHGWSLWGNRICEPRIDTALDWIDSIIGGGSTPPPPPEPRPDLVVGAIKITGTPVASAPVPLAISVVNLGNKPASEFFISVFLDRTTPVNNSTGSVVTQLVQGGLAVGETKTLAMTVTYLAPGAYTLAICADSERATLRHSLVLCRSQQRRSRGH